MPPKKLIKAEPEAVKTVESTAEESLVIKTLKKRYFEIVSPGKENYPNTPELTKEADQLEKEIKKLQGK